VIGIAMIVMATIVTVAIVITDIRQLVSRVIVMGSTPVLRTLSAVRVSTLSGRTFGEMEATAITHPTETEDNTSRYSVMRLCRVTEKAINVTPATIGEVTMVGGEMAAGPGKET